MPLYNMEHSCKVVDPVKLENGKNLQGLRRNVPDVTWNKIIRIIDDAIQNIVKTDIKQLTWGCTGSMLGNGSGQPHNDITYVWEKAKERLGCERLCSMTMGIFVRWRIALRNEEWYCNKVDTNTWDEIDQCYIYYYQYWICPQKS